MAFEIKWLKESEIDLDKEMYYVLNNFGLNAARKTKLKIDENEQSSPSGTIIKTRIDYHITC